MLQTLQITDEFRQAVEKRMLITIYHPDSRLGKLFLIVLKMGQRHFFIVTTVIEEDVSYRGKFRCKILRDRILFDAPAGYSDKKQPGDTFMGYSFRKCFEQS